MVSCAQVPLAQRVDAFAKLLQLSVEASQGAAYAPLSRLAVRFIAAQLQVRHKATWCTFLTQHILHAPLHTWMYEHTAVKQ